MLEGRLLPAAVDLQMPVDAEIDDGGGEAAIVEAHPVDIAGGGRRHARRRREQRNDGAARRIAADPQPGQDDNKRAAATMPTTATRERAIVLQPIARLLRARGRLDHALLPAGGDRQPVVRRQRAGGAEHDAAGPLLDHAGILALRALRPGVERGLRERRPAPAA